MANEIAQVATRLPFPIEAKNAYGLDADSWRVLTEAIFPAAQTAQSVMLALAYCKSRNLDPMKRQIHIVPVWDSKKKCLVETIWPGIGEIRTTASRTGSYAGKDKTAFGPNITKTFSDGKSTATVTFPEWAQLTVYRMVQGVRCPFEGPRVYWTETYATKGYDSEVPNNMWADRPSGQLEKCAEAAALRAAYPEELGNVYAAEEVEGRKFESIGRTAEGAELLKPMPQRKSETAAAPKAEPPPVDRQATPPPAAPTPAPTAGHSGEFRGLLTKIDSFPFDRKDRKTGAVTGQGKGYLLISGDKTFVTFSTTDLKIAEEAMGAAVPVWIKWEHKVGKLNPHIVDKGIEALIPDLDDSPEDLPDEPGMNG